MAEIDRVGAPDPNNRTSPISTKRPSAAKMHELAAHAACFWDGKQYSDGAQLCNAGRRLECWNGNWIDIGNC